MTKENIVIVGLGMLGMSLAASLSALKERDFTVGGWARRKEVAEEAVQKGHLDTAYGSVEEAFSQATIAVLTLPVPVIIGFMDTYGKFLPKGAVLTDIGSVKSMIEEAALKAKVNFVGSHPMAGTEKSGPEHMVMGIYSNAAVFVVPPEKAKEEDVLRIEKMWQNLGSHTLRITAKEHDSLVAHTSHVPHIISSALALSVLDAETPDLREMRFSGAASGFRDTIRVAASSPKMWREILSHNRKAVLEALDDHEKRYQKMRKMIEDNDFDAFEKEFAYGKALIEEWRRTKNF